MAFLQTGAPYKRRSSIPPVYIVFRAACFSPQLSFADLIAQILCAFFCHVVDVFSKSKLAVEYYAKVFHTVHLNRGFAILSVFCSRPTVMCAFCLCDAYKLPFCSIG